MKETESSKDGLSGDDAVVLAGDSAGFRNTCCTRADSQSDQVSTKIKVKLIMMLLIQML